MGATLEAGIGAVTKRPKGRTQDRRPDEPTTHDEDPILTLSQAAEQVGKTRTTIARWMLDGLIEGFRLPSGIPAVRQSELNRVLRGSPIERNRNG